MKFRFEKSDKNEIVAYANHKNNLINMIESLCLNDDFSLIGYSGNIIKELNPNLIECFITSNDKIYAIYKNERYYVKKRLYELYDEFKDSFIYINQGCLGNVSMVDHFEANLGGALIVVFKSGFKEYVSRRQIKNVKERLGIK